MNFLIALLKKATKGDNFRPKQNPVKYDDKIAQLNAYNPDQYSKINADVFTQIKKTMPSLTQNTSKGTILPGTK
jgi:hypothetical protein